MELWRPIRQWYEGSSLGRIRSIDRVLNTAAGDKPIKGKVLKPYKMPNGYLQVTLYLPCGTKKKEYVHRLVLEAFNGPAPVGMVCCHADGNRVNNAVENLRWDTVAANIADQFTHNTKQLGERHAYAKLTNKHVEEIKASNETSAALAKKYGASYFHIQHIRTGRARKHG